MTTSDYTQIDALLTRLGLSLYSHGPNPGVRDDNWPCLHYLCQLVRNDREVWCGPYRLSVGHCGIDSAVIRWDCPSEYQSLLCTWKANRGAQFQDKRRWAAAACWLAKQNGVKPSLRDVMYSLLSDAQPDIDGESFAVWASNFGHNPDSRKAESTYLTCCETGRAFRAAFTPAEISELREAFSDY